MTASAEYEPLADLRRGSRRAAVATLAAAAIVLGATGYYAWQLNGLQEEIAVKRQEQSGLLKDIDVEQQKLGKLKEEVGALETQLQVAREQKAAYREVYHSAWSAVEGKDLADVVSVAMTPRASAARVPGSTNPPLFDFVVWLDFPADASLAGRLRGAIRRVTYVFNHPSFASEKERSSTDASSGYAVRYTGWGALSTVIIKVSLADGRDVTLDFNMLAAVRHENVNVPEKGAGGRAEVVKGSPVKGPVTKEAPENHPLKGPPLNAAPGADTDPTQAAAVNDVPDAARVPAK